MDNTGMPADQPPRSDQPGNQPPPPDPTASPWAGPQPPFTGPPPPYTGVPPFPGQPVPGQPVSGQPEPYPGQPEPYPGQPQPYPGQSQPYPGQPLPYPGQPQPYPGQPQFDGPPPPWVAPPPAQWGPPPAPRRTSRWLVPVIVLSAIAVLGCLSAVGFRIVQATDNVASAGTADREARDLLPGADPSGPSADSGSTEPAGPEASTYPVRETNDLERVCDDVYYPQSPKFAGAAPHQISVGVVDRKDFPSRIIKAYVDVPYSLPQKVQNAWMPKDPAKTQLMACIDLVSTGAQVKKCTFDDPEPDTVVMKRGTYKLRLYEVATGRKLLEKQMAGSDKECPTMVLLGEDKTLYTAVDDRELYELLRSYVMKK